MKYIFVTGATGFIGSRLIKRLIQKGKYVKAFDLKTSDFSKIDYPHVEKIIGDITDPSSFCDKLENVEQIYHLAGVVTDWASKKLYKKVHIEGTKNLLDVAIQKQIPRVVHVSTIDVLKKNRYRENYLTDSHLYTNTKEPYSLTKKEAEKIALKYYKEKGLNLTVIRPAWVYGQGDTTLFPEIAWQIKKGSMLFIHQPHNYLPLVHVENLVDVMIKVGERHDLGGETFLVSDGETTWKEVADMIADKIGARRVNITLPYRFAYLISFISEEFANLIKQKKRPLLTRSAVEMVGISLRVNSEKAKQLLGYKPRISLMDGIKDTLEWISESDLENLRRK